jgi:hypothetical protein
VVGSWCFCFGLEVEQTSVCRAKCQVTLSLEQTGEYDVGQ